MFSRNQKEPFPSLKSYLHLHEFGFWITEQEEKTLTFIMKIPEKCYWEQCVKDSLVLHNLPRISKVNETHTVSTKGPKYDLKYGKTQ